MSDTIFGNKFNTKLGDMTIIGNEKGLLCLYFDNNTANLNKYNWKNNSKIFSKIINEIKAYLNGNLIFPFSPWKMGNIGTDFQKKVWNEMRRIQFGKTLTYSSLAKKIGNPNAARAVGGACNSNPILLLNPCHRVIGANGSLVGFGAGLKIKKSLINLEK